MDHLNVRPYDNRNPLLLPPCIDDFLAPGDPARVLDEVVENHIDLSALYRKVPEVGNPSYHPRMMVKILFYGYATGVRESRKICKKLSIDVAFIFLAGMQKPDFRTISDFRKNNLEEITQIFAQIVKLCHQLGMVKFGTISLDSKVFKGNASPAKSLSEEQLIKKRDKIAEQIRKHLEEAVKVDEQADAIYGRDKSGDELPDDISTREKRLKKLEEAKARLEEARKRARQQEVKKINLTDGDASIQRDKGRKCSGYRGQIVVDAKEQVILVQDVTNEQCDAHQLIPMVDKSLNAIRDLKNNPRPANTEPVEGKVKFLADSGYSSLNNLAELQGRDEIDLYVPDQDYRFGKQGGKKEKAPFSKNKFIFEPQENRFICPAGKELKFFSNKKSRNGEATKVYRCSDCQSCPHFGICTKSKRGRTIRRYEHEHLMKEMRCKLSSERGRENYALRKCTVEPALGNLAQNLGYREFLLRGLRGVKGEFSLVCIGHNLLKIAMYLKRERLSVTGCRMEPIRVQDG